MQVDPAGDQVVRGGGHVVLVEERGGRRHAGHGGRGVATQQVVRLAVQVALLLETFNEIRRISFVN